MTAGHNLPRIGFTVRETAEQLGKTEGAVRQLINREVIPAIRVGGTVYVPAAWFEEQYERATRAAAAAMSSGR